MYFLEDQVLEYDKKRMSVKRIEQNSLFVHDEKSTIQWLEKELREKQQTFQEIQPKFLREISDHKDEFEKLPELIEILEQRFHKDELGRYYIPDPNTQSDLEKSREKILIKEFNSYHSEKGKLKIFRTEQSVPALKNAGLIRIIQPLSRLDSVCRLKYYRKMMCS